MTVRSLKDLLKDIDDDAIVHLEFEDEGWIKVIDLLGELRVAPETSRIFLHGVI